MSILSRVRMSRDAELSPKWKMAVWNTAMTVMLVLAADAFIAYAQMRVRFDGTYLLEVVGITALVIGLAAAIGFELIKMPWGTGRIIVGLVFVAYVAAVAMVAKVVLDGGLALVLGQLQKVHLIQPGDNVSFVASAYFAASLIGFVGGVSGIWFSQFPSRLPLRLPFLSRSGVPRVTKSRSRESVRPPIRVTPGSPSPIPQQRTMSDDGPAQTPRVVRPQHMAEPAPPHQFGTMPGTFATSTG